MGNPLDDKHKPHFGLETKKSHKTAIHPTIVWNFGKEHVNLQYQYKKLKA